MYSQPSTPKYFKTFFIFLLCTFSLQAQVRFANIFTDGAVLQRNKPIKVWGFGPAKTKVIVSLATQSIKTDCDATGKWSVTFNTLPAGGPHVLKLQANTQNLELKDILLGDVWLCSGQSNMEWSVDASNDFNTEKRNANFPNIRHIKVPNVVELSPQQDIKASKWETASAETIGQFTAVGFFFARKIHLETGVPIGLINSSWGGSQVESWISKEAMLTDAELAPIAQKLPSNWTDADALFDQRMKKGLFAGNATPTASDEAAYKTADFDFKNWKKWNSALDMWEWNGFQSFRGTGYLGKTMDIPQDFTTQPTELHLGINNAYNEVYVNGIKLFAGTETKAKILKVPANTWKTKNNKILLKIGTMIDPTWYGLGIIGNNKDFVLTNGTEEINISRDWWAMPSFTEKYHFNHGMNNHSTILFNAMINPIVDYAIAGALWYQGESNAGRAAQYIRSFPLMISDWRNRWKDTFPFYFVQLTSYGGFQDSNQGSNWAELREAQTKTLSLPKTGMAVILDAGNVADIHPTDKQTVGTRLAAISLKNDYGKTNIKANGPIYKSVTFKNGQAEIAFETSGESLVAKDKYGYLKGFEIAGADQKFYWAEAKIVNNTVQVSNHNVKEPVAVRYAWSDGIEDANLFSSNGLPCGTFRTDNWELKTKNIKFD